MVRNLASSVFVIGFALLGAAVAPACATAAARPTSADLDRLARALEGAWTIVDSSYASPGSPPPEPRRGTEDWTLDRGGLTLTETYHATTPKETDDETAVLWWDGKGRALRGLWCASINDEGCNGFEAHADGAAFVMSGEWEFQGRRSAWKETFVMHGRDAFTQRLEIGPAGGTLAPASTIHAVRRRH